MKYQVHESAIVDEGAQIGDGTAIWHFAHVSAGAKIGDSVTLGQNTYVANQVTIGNFCRIQNNVSIFDGVTLEEGVFCGPSVVFTNVNNPRALVERKTEYRETKVCRGASLGANATVVCGVTIGSFAFVGAGAVVTNDVPAYALVVGNPARLIGWMSAHGERLDLPVVGSGSAECPFGGETYVLKSGVLTIKDRK